MLKKFESRDNSKNTGLRCARSWIAVGFLLLAACGGSEDDTVRSFNPTGEAPSLAISSITPDSGPIGSTVRVDGIGMNNVNAVKLAGVSANFVILSATSLDITVPVNAISGRIEISFAGNVALSPGNFTVSGTPVPVARTVTPARVLPGGQITVTGTSFDQLSRVMLGNLVLPIVSRNSTTLILNIPPGATSNFLTLVDLQSVARQSTAVVTVLQPMTIAAFSPTTAARSSTIAVTGTNLDRATHVIFAGGATASVTSHNGSSAVTAMVPAGAMSGVITVSAGGADTAVSVSSLTVVDAIVVTPITHTVAPGQNVTISGAGLTEVSAVTVAGTPATIVNQSSSQLTFTPPAGIACGAIVFQSLSQPDVAAGSVVIGSSCSVRTAAVEFAQLFSRESDDPFERLVPGKESWLRAYVVSTASGTPAPAVRAVGFIGNTQVGSITLNGPSTLPLLGATSSVPSSMRSDDTLTFNAEMPDTWTRAGMRVRIEVDPAQQFGPTITTDVVPPVGTDTVLDLVLVPLVSGTNQPLMPTPAEVIDEVVRRLPIARGRISVTQRAPYTLTSVTNGVDTSTDWSRALSELENLRDSEAPGKQYYGMVRPMVSAGTAGIGYVNAVTSSSPALSSLGWDASRSSWRKTMIHEFGHNYSRRHAPCGGVAGPDANYPYANGALGHTPLFDSLIDRIISSSGLKDIMGYCNGIWFSDYNLREIQRFLEARPQPLVAASITGTSTTTASTLVISGSISPEGVKLAPVSSASRYPRDDQKGQHVVRITTRTGATIERAFEAASVDHGSDESHFRVDVPDPGEIASIQILHNGLTIPVSISQQLPSPASQPAAGVSTAATRPANGPWVQAAASAGALEITWNSVVTPFATITLVNGDMRQILAVNATGGRTRFPYATLAQGDVLEISVSDGLNARVLRLPRP